MWCLWMYPASSCVRAQESKYQPVPCYFNCFSHKYRSCISSRAPSIFVSGDTWCKMSISSFTLSEAVNAKKVTGIELLGQPKSFPGADSRWLVYTDTRLRTTFWLFIMDKIRHKGSCPHKKVTKLWTMDGQVHKNGWIFRKLPNGLWPPPPSFRKTPLATL